MERMSNNLSRFPNIKQNKVEKKLKSINFFAGVGRSVFGKTTPKVIEEPLGLRSLLKTSGAVFSYSTDLQDSK